jgi:hypothetical protein
MKFRYAGVYSGPSYGNPHAPSFEGFTSIAEAEHRFRERQETSGAYRLPVASLVTGPDGEIRSYGEHFTYWPATTPQDTVELYEISDGYVGHEPFLRLSAGPRGGIVRENY